MALTAAREIFRELIPINLINLMVIMGFQYVNAVPRRMPGNIEVPAEGLVPSPDLNPLWIFPVVASVIYIVLTILQFFVRGVFAPKTLIIFFIADVDLSFILHETGRIPSFFTGMIPSAVLLVLYVCALLYRRRGARYL